MYKENEGMGEKERKKCTKKIREWERQRGNNVGVRENEGVGERVGKKRRKRMSGWRRRSERKTGKG